MPTYKGISGKSWDVADKPFAGGGEGDVFNIIGNTALVAKIYQPDKRTTERERKLSIMVKTKPSVLGQYAWPFDVLYYNGKFSGYIMPKVVGKEKLRNIYVYDNRRGKPWTLFIAIAKNIASAVHNVHEIGHVIGDLNSDNILVDPHTGLVTLVDIDSYHITDKSGYIYRCGMGVAEFVAPEIQGKHFPSAPLPTFTKETDLFALAVMIFVVLMNGAHPFACKTTGGSSSSFQPVENIARGISPYFKESSASNLDIPRYAPALTCLPAELQELFRRAFVLGHKNPKNRPSAEEYYHALERLEKKIKACRVNKQHLYYRLTYECPWCRVDQKMNAVTQTLHKPGVVSPAKPTPVNPKTVKPTFKKKHSFMKKFVAIIILALIFILPNTLGRKEVAEDSAAENTAPVASNIQPVSVGKPENTASATTKVPVVTTSVTTTVPGEAASWGLEVRAMNAGTESVPAINSVEFTIVDDSGAENINGQIDQINQRLEYDFIPTVTGMYRFEFSNVTKNARFKLLVMDDKGEIMESGIYMDNDDGISLSLDFGRNYRLWVEQFENLGSFSLNIKKQKSLYNISNLTAVSDSVQFIDQQNNYLFDPSIDGSYRFEFSDVPDVTKLSLYVFNSAGEIIKSNFDMDTGDGLTLWLYGGQTYTLQVRQYENFGAYKLNIGHQKNFYDLSYLSAVTDSIQYKDQKNNYIFTAENKGDYRFEFSGVPEGTDLYLTVYNTGWEILESGNDMDSGDGLTVTLYEGQKCYIQVIQYENTGSYTLNIGHQKKLLDISFYTWVTDSIQFTDQKNNYQYTAKSNGDVRFEFSTVPEGTDLDLTIYDSGWDVIMSGSDLDSGDGLTVSLAKGQTVYIRVGQYENTGHYKLNVKR